MAKKFKIRIAHKVVDHLTRLWHDRDIRLGENWGPGIEAELKKAHIAIMLISKDFLDSDFIRREEIPRILQRRETGEELAVSLNLSVLPAVYISLDEIKEWLGLGDNGVVHSLVKKGWLRREKGSIYMHPVVQEVTRHKAGPGVKTCEGLIDSLTKKLSVAPGENPLDKKGYVVFAETHEKAATLANNLSLICQALGQPEKALEFQLKDIAISEKVLDKNHPNLAASYHNLSLIYRDKKDFPRALAYAEKAALIWRHLFPNGHPHLDLAKKNLEAIKQELPVTSRENR